MRKTLVIYPQVYDDIKAIKDYIAKDDIVQSEKVAKAIVDDINSLAEMPESGANFQNKVKQKTKYKYIMTYRNYATLYYVNKDSVYVALVMHTAKDLSALKLIEQKNE